MGQSFKGEQMVRIIILTLLLTGCAAQHVKLGKEVKAPWGWEYTYCPDHAEDPGCKK